MSNIIMEMDGLIFCNTRLEYLDFISGIERANNDFVFVWPRERHIEAMDRPDEMHVSIIGATTRELLGYLILAGIGGEDRALEFRRMVIAEKGKGYGRTSTRFVKEYCFGVLKYHRLWLDAYTDNEVAIGLYEKEGFVREGLLRDCKRNGDQYRSMVIMSMLENEYKG
ncbi:MAG: GNAT family N-acetyltransferase [Pseudomonadota bacterium]